MLSLFVFSLYFDHLPTDRLQMGEVVSTIPTSNGPKRLAENIQDAYAEAASIAEQASLFTSFILPASSFGFLFSSDASYVFDGQPPDLKKQELAKRYSKRADATEDLQEAMEVFFFGQTWSDK
ncbi:uncharacterized protein LOC105788571 isoform X1 [Gossypium raimondii]|uniref:uncharacterized protein LOC105788571 isoform X1 n=1 Tax=Gossypium raimondii TaxID=29730 RepID=UPI00063AB72D|nr:uncharacterized protein LOC105788571 isoform X1 [Gossypium raimondii]